MAHTLPLQHSPFSGCGPVAQLGEGLAALRAGGCHGACPQPRPAHWRRCLPALAPGVFRTLRTPLHAEGYGYLQAGKWLRKHASQGQNIATPESLPCFYAGRDDDRFWDYSHPPLSDATLDRILTESQPAEYLVVSDHYVQEHERPQGLPEQTRGYRLEPMKRFRADRDARGQTQILIYRITPTSDPS